MLLLLFVEISPEGKINPILFISFNFAAVGVGDAPPPPTSGAGVPVNDREEDPAPVSSPYASNIAEDLILGFRYFIYSLGMSSEMSLSNENESRISGGKMDIAYRSPYKF